MSDEQKTAWWRKAFCITLAVCILLYLGVSFALADDGRARQLGALFACGCPCCIF